MSKQPESLALAREFRLSMPPDVMTEWASDATAELRRQHAEIERLQAERDALKAALRRLHHAAPFGLECNDFHHGKRQQHSAMVACPQVFEYVEALEQARAAISTATGAAA